MPRRPDLDPPTQLEVSIPTSIRAQLDLSLFSNLEGRVPQGAYKTFFVERIKEYFNWKRLDLVPLGFPEGYFIAGPKEMVEHLERRLHGSSER